jgi:hypothetical protein
MYVVKLSFTFIMFKILKRVEFKRNIGKIPYIMYMSISLLIISPVNAIELFIKTQHGFS